MTTTHPADGLYYVTREMLKQAGACYVADAIAYKFDVTANVQIPITLHNVRWLDKNYHGGLFWATCRMFDRDKITENEFNSFHGRTSRATPKAFMDMLLARAKREGLVK